MALQQYSPEYISFKVVSLQQLAAFYCNADGSQFSIQSDTPFNIYEYDANGNLVSNSIGTTSWGPVIDANTLVGYYTGLAQYATLGGLSDLFIQVMFPSGNISFYMLVPVSKIQLTNLQAGSLSDAQSLLNNLMSNEQNILEENLVCARLISYLDAKGVTVTSAQRQQLYDLQTRLQAREADILQAPGLSQFQYSQPAGFSNFSSDLQNFMSNPGIGIAPILLAIIISSVITAVFAFLLYEYLKPTYAESKADLKVSADLAKALSTLDPETKQKVITDLNGQVDAAYVQGKMDGSGGSILSTLKSGALILGGIFLLPVLSSAIDKLQANPKYTFKKK